MDRNVNKDGLALCFEEDIPSRQNSSEIDDKEIEHSFVEMNLEKKIVNFVFI